MAEPGSAPTKTEGKDADFLDDDEEECDPSDTLLLALRTAIARLRVVAGHAREQVIVLAEAAAIHSVQAAQETARGVQKGCAVASRGTQQGAKAAVAYARVLRQAPSMLPVLQRVVSTTYEALEEIKQSEVLQLRRLEDLPPFVDYVSRLVQHVDILLAELRLMPRSAVFCGTVVVLRLVSAVNGLADVFIDEMLHSRTAVSNIGVVAAIAPGCLLVHHFWHVLLHQVNTDALCFGEVASPSEPSTWQRLEAASTLARNARKMPIIFWLTTAISGSVALQIAREVASRVIRRTLSVRLRSLMLLGVLHQMYLRKELVIEMVSSWVQRLLPHQVDILRGIYLQAVTVKTLSAAAFWAAARRVAFSLWSHPQNSVADRTQAGQRSAVRPAGIQGLDSDPPLFQGRAHCPASSGPPAGRAASASLGTATSNSPSEAEAVHSFAAVCSRGPVSGDPPSDSTAPSGSSAIFGTSRIGGAIDNCPKEQFWSMDQCFLARFEDIEKAPTVLIKEAYGGSVAVAVELLNQGKLRAPAGICAAWSFQHQATVVLYDNDHAEEAASLFDMLP